ncbi:ribonuclease domain-containing protein [uncultured Friedmanniella sp.]|uniref:ribonuclease domain-containing protein n=1 Tax=uncultured Friedmanniella sp. TaxID=335381 RepID=UPI0035CBE069
MSPRARAVGSVLALVVLGLLFYLLGPGDDGTSTARPAATVVGSATVAGSATASAGPDPETGLPQTALASLPVEARRTVTLIDRGGPFPYRQDGAVFANREGRLPRHPSGWYHEYTVVTPGSDDRGARRLITGDGSRQIFWTADHYASFSRVQR